MRRDRKPGQRAGISREQVLAEAQALLSESGLERLSMRTLAQRIGVAPNALYSHVASKNDLLDALLDDTLRLVVAPDPHTDDPLDGLRALMTSTYDVLSGHAALVPVYLARQGSRGPHAVRLGQLMDTWLDAVGMPAHEIPAARRVLIIHTIGFAAFSLTAPDDDRPIPTADARAHFTRSLEWLLAGMTSDRRF